jgi:predicted O-methyltransferase YrrM
MTGGGSSLPEVRALLRVLAAGRDVVELGTAFGEGAAAMSETARSVVTVERDHERAAIAHARLAGLATSSCSRVTPTSSCAAAARSGSCSPTAAATTGRAILELVAPGGLIVKDDLTPGRPVAGDAVREFLFGDPRLAAVEISVTPASAAIVAVKLR